MKVKGTSATDGSRGNHGANDKALQNRDGNQHTGHHRFLREMLDASPVRAAEYALHGANLATALSSSTFES